ncbi:nucleoside-diphosphate kinase [Clostridium tagluense]|uniref:nucleoside-diphosphate kinase n=1 Tax=Clostridium tagluense TaxID=360422 RepID=UPI001CF2656B|nr:nucleoside-diphosphate kinase [Clostridium tagluense]MCB2312699.1 nucleoside-diphosphate kinase [Clostridium tagluense]MCB2317465.1 nucleoside-diphosphate kinase [Clostridium tagluense]MCB2322186.1 nucleoside-diphosphate kinase [Clostridium tagluense]MCB2327192.1 nucleoside-diphosphate kinase [Clostridium tagluense]MCB2331966.1 nucleoside-diphosphate kinase [Clostridium tagluense]
MERTLVLIKPDGVKRGLIGKILNHYEEKSLEIVALKLITATTDDAKEHYREHEGREYFEELINYITEGKLCVMILKGEKAIDVVRKINGDKDPVKAELASIRGEFTLDKTHNLVHASDSPESAEREIAIWFSELTCKDSYKKTVDLLRKIDGPLINV